MFNAWPAPQKDEPVFGETMDAFYSKSPEMSNRGLFFLAPCCFLSIRIRYSWVTHLKKRKSAFFDPPGQLILFAFNGHPIYNLTMRFAGVFYFRLRRWRWI